MAEREIDMIELISKNVCDNCGGRVDRPGLYRCVLPCHPTPTLAQRVVAAIDRSGMSLSRLDDDISLEVRQEIHDALSAIVEEELARTRWTLTGPPWRLEAL